MIKASNQLKLSEQLCFPLYATSRLITRLYQPLLRSLGVTYPQYLVLLVLWEKNNRAVTEIGNALQLNTNTLTPVIKKLVEKKFVTKKRGAEDEREVVVSLTPRGEALKERAECIPGKLLEQSNVPLDDLLQLRKLMWRVLEGLEQAN